MANNSNRKAIEFMVQGALPPHSTNVLWMDTSVPELPVLKIFENGAWTTVHTGDSKSIELLAETVLAQQKEITELTENLGKSLDNVTENLDTLQQNVAQEATLTQGVQDIREDISHIDIDTSDLAKQGTNPNATLSEVQAQATNAANDAAAAKEAAQAITGYALQGNDPAATNTAIASTLGTPSDLDTVHTVFGHLTQLKGILDLVNTHVGSDSLTLNEKLDIIRTVIGEISLVRNNDNVGSGNQAWTLVLNQSLAVNNETLEQA